jgi:preprotein translocase subunit YajC
MLFALQILLAQADQGQPQGGGAFQLIFMVVGFLFLGYFLIWLPGKKQRKEQQAMLGALKKNDKIITAGGLIGVIANVKDDEVTLKVDESSNVRLRVTKSSIVRVVRDEESTKEQKEGAA